jgi:hypothetical protein
MSFEDFLNGKGISGSNLKTGNFWLDNGTDLPLDGLLDNRDEDELKDVLKNDSNLHRRTFALAILFNLIDKDYDNFSGYFAHVVVELGIDRNEVGKLTQDYLDLIKAIDFITKDMGL